MRQDRLNCRVNSTQQLEFRRPEANPVSGAGDFAAKWGERIVIDAGAVRGADVRDHDPIGNSFKGRVPCGYGQLGEHEGVHARTPDRHTSRGEGQLPRQAAKTPGSLVEGLRHRIQRSPPAWRWQRAGVWVSNGTRHGCSTAAHVAWPVHWGVPAISVHIGDVYGSDRDLGFIPRGTRLQVLGSKLVEMQWVVELIELEPRVQFPLFPRDWTHRIPLDALERYKVEGKLRLLGATGVRS